MGKYECQVAIYMILAGLIWLGLLYILPNTPLLFGFEAKQLLWGIGSILVLLGVIRGYFEGDSEGGAVGKLMAIVFGPITIMTIVMLHLTYRIYHWKYKDGHKPHRIIKALFV